MEAMAQPTVVGEARGCVWGCACKRRGIRTHSTHSTGVCARWYVNSTVVLGEFHKLHAAYV